MEGETWSNLPYDAPLVQAKLSGSDQGVTYRAISASGLIAKRLLLLSN